MSHATALKYPNDDAVELSLQRAPLDDEAETEEERASVEAALRDLREGRTSSHREVVGRLGLE